MAEELTHIAAPVLAENYGSNIVEVFNNINNNFGVVGNKDLYKGEKGDGILTSVVEMKTLVTDSVSFTVTINDVSYTISSQKDNIKSAFMVLKGVVTTDTDIDNVMGQLSSSTDDVVINIKNKGLQSGSTTVYDADIIAIHPYVFMDDRFNGDALQDIQSLSALTDMSCVMSVDYGVPSNQPSTPAVTTWKCTRAFPTLYYNAGEDHLCWIINSSNTQIPAQGPRGINGKDGHSWVIKLSGNYSVENMYVASYILKDGSTGDWVTLDSSFVGPDNVKPKIGDVCFVVENSLNGVSGYSFWITVLNIQGEDYKVWLSDSNRRIVKFTESVFHDLMNLIGGNVNNSLFVPVGATQYGALYRDYDDRDEGYLRIGVVRKESGNNSPDIDRDPDQNPIAITQNGNVYIEGVGGFDYNSNPSTAFPIQSALKEVTEDEEYLHNSIIFKSDKGVVINQLTLTVSSGSFNIDYSLDNKSWTSLSSLNSNKDIIFYDRIYLRGKNNSLYNLNIKLANKASVSGNIMSLIDWTDPDHASMSSNCFAYLFLNCSRLTTASKLKLPAVTLTDGCYEYMFSGCTSLIDAPELPATTLAGNCYYNMFVNCTSIVIAPELPATILASGCYNGMFSSCESLTTAPELPATTLADYCYDSMFLGCISLTVAPELPATTLTEGCYEGMFSGCESLNTITCLATDISASGCVDSWLTDTAADGTLFKDPSMNYWIVGTNIPANWNPPENYVSRVINYTDLSTDQSFSSQNYVTFIADNDYSYFGLTKISAYQTLYIKKEDESGWKNMNYQSGTSYCFKMEKGVKYFVCGGLSEANDMSNYTNFIIKGNVYSFGSCNSIWNINTLSSYCGYKMFSNCDGLVISPELPATTLANVCYEGMFYGCTSLTQAPELPATTLADFCYREMFLGCTSLTTAPELPADTLANYCYYNMFYGCTSLVTAPELPATTLANGCYSSMFSGCTSLITAPELPATTLAPSCYGYMFTGCTSLTQAPELPATVLADSCYNSMFSRCISLTTAPELHAPTPTSQCYYRMFYNCSSLSSITCLASSASSDNWCTNWMGHDNGVSMKDRGLFIGAMGSGWSRGVNGIPSGWTYIYGDIQ